MGCGKKRLTVLTAVLLVAAMWPHSTAQKNSRIAAGEEGPTPTSPRKSTPALTPSGSRYLDELIAAGAEGPTATTSPRKTTPAFTPSVLDDGFFLRRNRATSTLQAAGWVATGQASSGGHTDQQPATATHSRPNIPKWIADLIIAAISAAVIVAVEEGVRRYCCRKQNELDTPAPPPLPTVNIQLSADVRPNNMTADESDDRPLIAGSSSRQGAVTLAPQN